MLTGRANLSFCLLNFTHFYKRRRKFDLPFVANLSARRFGEIREKFYGEFCYKTDCAISAKTS